MKFSGSPLRQAAIPLGVSAESIVDKVARLEMKVQPDNVAETTTDLLTASGEGAVDKDVVEI